MLDEVAREFRAEVRESASAIELPRFNIAPGQRVPVVRAGERGVELVGLTWGLIPRWADDEKIAYRTVNARSETAHEKPAFRDAFKKRRCLLPATGFYEWKSEGAGPKQPFAARRDGGRLYAMAGLWEAWTDPASGETRETCTVLTCPANTRLRRLHERMPVILPPVEHAVWLDTRVEGVEALRAMLRPDPARHWSAHPVSRRVNNPRHDDPALLEEVMDESEGLFGG